MMIELTDALREAIYAHAGREAPRECCGLLVRDADAGTLHYLPARNLHEGASGHDRFVLDPEAWWAAEEFGAVLAVVHSHPHASANPSMADRVQCEKSRLPWLVMGWPSGVVKQLEPEGWSAPLVGREFVHGVLDCYTLIQDWYRREWQVSLPDFERADFWWQRGEDLYRKGFGQAGFQEVEGTPRHGDVLLMRIRSEQENHGGVFLEEDGGCLLHHLYDRLSSREIYGDAWRRRTTAVLRHRSRLGPRP